MLWIKAFHIIFMVAWFAGLFYLPRLFVYHADTRDSLGQERFKVMEYKLYYFIMTPAALLTTIFGIWLLAFNWVSYLAQPWLHAKLGLVVLLWVYHLWCGNQVKRFQRNMMKTSRFYRFINEIPTLLLIGIVILVVVKP